MTQPKYQVPLDRTANEPISQGIHLFIITKAEEGESSSGNPMWTFTLTCQTPGEEGKEVRLYLPLTPNTRWKLELFFDAVKAPPSGSVTADKFVNRSLRAQITHEDYEGRKQARIGEMYPASKPAAATVRPQAVAVAKIDPKEEETDGEVSAGQTPVDVQPSKTRKKKKTGLPSVSDSDGDMPF